MLILMFVLHKKCLCQISSLIMRCVFSITQIIKSVFLKMRVIFLECLFGNQLFTSVGLLS